MAIQYRSIATLALVCVLVFAGCSSPSGGDNATTPAGAPITPATTTAEPTTATPTLTETRTPTATATPSPPPSPTPTPVPTSTATSASPSPIDGGETRTATVIGIVDGDTIDVRFPNGKIETIRLVGVDTPETAEQYMDPSEYGIPNTPQGRDWLLMWGDNATEFATQRLAGERVTVVFDPESDRRGGFGRLLAYIYSDGQNVGRELVERGLARVYTGGEFSLESAYLDIEADAQADNRGLWGFEGAVTPTPTVTATATATLPPDDDGSGFETPTPSNDGDLPDPYDCGDFDRQEVAQQWFDNHNPDEDPSGLDSDGDGVACE